MEIVKFNGWDCIRLSNGTVELLVTRSIGPRIVRYGFVGKDNIFAEIESQKYTSGEKEWKNRGGHRLWIAPESFPWSYEPDNEPYIEATEIPGGIHLRQAPGPVTGVQKEMDIFLDEKTGFVRLHHRLTNLSGKTLKMSLWTVNACGTDGVEVIPLPEKKPHSMETLLPSQNLALWTYTDLSDKRWTFGSKYILLRQDPAMESAQKLGLRNRSGWLAYQRSNMLFVMKFDHRDDAIYPDYDCNCETFTNSEITELECLGPMVTLNNGESVEQDEEWKLYDGFAPIQGEDDVTKRVLPLI